MVNLGILIDYFVLMNYCNNFNSCWRGLCSLSISLVAFCLKGT